MAHRVTLIFMFGAQQNCTVKVKFQRVNLNADCIVILKPFCSNLPGVSLNLFHGMTQSARSKHLPCQSEILRICCHLKAAHTESQSKRADDAWGRICRDV